MPAMFRHSRPALQEWGSAFASLVPRPTVERDESSRSQNESPSFQRGFVCVGEDGKGKQRLTLCVCVQAAKSSLL
jgi:hypothetical protein